MAIVYVKVTYDLGLVFFEKDLGVVNGNGLPLKRVGIGCVEEYGEYCCDDLGTYTMHEHDADGCVINYRCRDISGYVFNTKYVSPKIELCYRGGFLCKIIKKPEELKGFYVVRAERTSETFTLIGEKSKVVFHHTKDCCEEVWLDDVCGDIDDLGGHITSCSLVTNSYLDHNDDHVTWSFYVIETEQGGVTLRFCGTSNGYYSEEVDIEIMPLI